MNRVERLHAQVSAARASVADVFLTPASDAPGLDPRAYAEVLTPAAVAFVADMAVAFRADVSEMLGARQARRLRVEQQGWRPDFLPETRAIREDDSWTIDAVPAALRDRRVDVGDVSPADAALFLRALHSGAQGVQVDFDDGHCPTWRNTVQGHKNLMDAARGCLHAPSVAVESSSSPALLLVRPRAWNMDELNMLVDGQVVPGAIVDFALHVFHNGALLFEQARGPFLYLSKLEGHREAALWARIFAFAEARLGLPRGAIRATVLIESIFAAFEMDEVLFALRHHSAGLNCGVWDYTASLAVAFRHAPAFVLPDRQRYVSMTRATFLRSYMALLIATCRRRAAPATTGMVPLVLAQLPADVSPAAAVRQAADAKRAEALAGADGALVFDLALVAPVQRVFDEVRRSPAPAPPLGAVDAAAVRAELLSAPRGAVWRRSVAFNLRVALAYVLAWLSGRGTAVVDGCVEDSATAEIARAQLWQWVYHRTPLAADDHGDDHGDDRAGDRTGDGAGGVVTARMVRAMLDAVARADEFARCHSRAKLDAARALVAQLATARTPPAFLTTFLLEQQALGASLAA